MLSISAALHRATVLLVALAMLGASGAARAQLRLDITQGVRDAVPIAIVPFGGQADGAPTDVAAVIANDLGMSGKIGRASCRERV